MSKFIKLLVLVISISIISSCENTNCNNSNPIFNNLSSDSKEYKDELVKQIENANESEIKFYFENYYEKNNLQFLKVNILGKNLCAKMELSITDSKNGIEEIIKSKGKSYQGAELKNLHFNINKDSTKTEFIFEKISSFED
jgi:hypothetical protein